MGKTTELEEGATFAGFVVVKKLSSGGMGSVYRVTQVSTGRPRALKLMHTDLADNEDLRAKFVREARLGSTIESDHVVEVVDAGVDAASGIPWIAMELLLGEDLGALVARVGRLDPDQVSSIFEQLTHAIGAAHAAGIVHRDLKPENVFVAATHSAVATLTVKVLDFGIAKLIAEAQTSSNTGAMGSAYWMAPEQTERSAAITPATDVWALGLIAYRLFTGRIFWMAAADRNASVTMFLRELVFEPLPSASARAAEQGVAGLLPAGFDAWFARCVARDRTARYQDGHAAGAAFRALRGAGRSFAEAPTMAGGLPVIVRGSSQSLSPEGDAAIGTARTIAEGRRRIEPEEETAAVVPKARAPVALLVAGVGALAAAGLALFWSRAPPSASSGGDPGAIAPPGADLRCPKTMVPVPGGTFTMGSSAGSPDERPAHSVSLNAFCLDMTEVQVGEYGACVSAKACEPAPKDVAWKDITPEDKALYSAACNGDRADRADHPVNCVTWDQAHAFCHWANKRLPTEEEWEFAARGPESHLYAWGNDPPSKERLNGCGEECAKGPMLGDMGRIPLFAGRDGWETTAPTRLFPAGKTPGGAFDLTGNVSEWTNSRFCPYPGNNCATEWRVAKGGAWNSDGREGVKASRRERDAHDARTADLGFRCAL